MIKNIHQPFQYFKIYEYSNIKKGPLNADQNGNFLSALVQYMLHIRIRRPNSIKAGILSGMSSTIV